jgi:hypothetical protein
VAIMPPLIKRNMKMTRCLKLKFLLGFAIALSVESAFCQGAFEFTNGGGNGSARAPIYGPDPDNPYLQTWGNAPDATPPGTQSYSGPRLTGTNYSVQAWYSLVPATDDFQLIGAARPVSDAPTSFAAGFPGFFAGYGTIPDAIPTPSSNYPFMVYLQVRTWDNAGGQLGSWADAWNAAQAGSGRAVGWSKVFVQPLGDGSAKPDPGMFNFESFNVYVVPEPGTVSLVVLGGAALFWGIRYRRRFSSANDGLL